MKSKMLTVRSSPFHYLGLWFIIPTCHLLVLVTVLVKYMGQTGGKSLDFWSMNNIWCLFLFVTNLEIIISLKFSLSQLLFTPRIFWGWQSVSGGWHWVHDEKHFEQQIAVLFTSAWSGGLTKANISHFRIWRRQGCVVSLCTCVPACIQRMIVRSRLQLDVQYISFPKEIWRSTFYRSITQVKWLWLKITAVLYGFLILETQHAIAFLSLSQLC